MKRHTPEEIVTKLRRVEALVAEGATVGAAVRETGVTEVWSEPASAVLPHFV